MPFRLMIAGVATAVLTALSAGCQRTGPERKTRQTDRASSRPSLPSAAVTASGDEAERSRFVGSESCRDCHEKFYQLWATSYHGLAMQPYTPEFGRQNLVPPAGEVAIGKSRYRAEIDAQGGRIRQRGPDGEKTYPIVHVMGGKNVYYFLTPLEQGPLAGPAAGV